MKKIAYAVLVSMCWLTVAAEAFASPAVGDSASYVGKAEVFGKKVKFEKTQTLAAYDAAQNKFKQVDVTSVVGEDPVMQEEWLDASTFPSDSTMEYALNHCVEQNGRLETIKVKAGTFETCRVVIDNGGIVHIGKVPFAMIKGSNKQMEIELVGFQRGKQD